MTSLLVAAMPLVLSEGQEIEFAADRVDGKLNHRRAEVTTSGGGAPQPGRSAAWSKSGRALSSRPGEPDQDSSGISTRFPSFTRESLSITQ